MREVMTEIDAWRQQGKKVALATVVKAYGSAPRPAGAKMAIAETADFVGSVSGGCVELAVIEEALEVLKTGRPKLVAYGITQDMLWEVGLACGGIIHVFVEPYDAALEIFEALKARVEAQAPAVAATVVRSENFLGRKAVVLDGGSVFGSLGDPELDRQAVADALGALEAERPEVKTYRLGDQEVEVFYDPYPAPPKLVILGGVHTAIPLAKMAGEVGFRVIVADPRAKFANRERFPTADEILVAWPEEALARVGVDRSTYIAILTHDPKIDEPALRAALNSPARYIGAIGARKTHAERVEKLRSWGFSDEQISRIYAPIGLNIGAVTPEEIAVSILAEIIAVRRQAELGRRPRPAAAEVKRQ
jgi:xanthine dehydrogenase accessory factor